MSMTFDASPSRLLSSSSATRTYWSFANSYPRTSAARSTTSLQTGQQFCSLMRQPHFAWGRLKATDCDAAAVQRLTGIATSPHGLAQAVVGGRSRDRDDGIDGAPEWERRVYRSLLGSRADALADALRWYEELEGESLEPSVDLHLAILEGEAGRAERLRGRFDEWTRRGEPFGTFRHLVALAYLSVGSGGADATGLVAQVDAHLEPGWFRDRLVARLTRAEAPNPRAGPLLVRLRVITLVEVAILALALVTLAWWARHPGERSDVAPLPPPWPGRTGVDVLLRGGALWALLLAALFLGAALLPGEPAHPYVRVVVGTATTLALLPVILMAWWWLLRPSG